MLLDRSALLEVFADVLGLRRAPGSPLLMPSALSAGTPERVC